MEKKDMESLRQKEETEETRIGVLCDRFRQMERDGRVVEATCAEGELFFGHGIWLKRGFLN